jgi:hypothetical protein
MAYLAQRLAAFDKSRTTYNFNELRQAMAFAIVGTEPGTKRAVLLDMHNALIKARAASKASKSRR